jgi:hypothetical protein
MSDANRVSLRRNGPEAVWNTVNSNPAFKEIRFKSAALAYAPKTVVSEEIRSDRQITDLPLVGFEASGNTTHEFSFDAFHEELQDALFNNWTANPEFVNVSSDTPITDIGTATITVASGGAVMKTGMLVRYSGSSVPANNKVVKMSADGTGTSLTVAAATFTAEAVVPAGARLKVVGFQGVAGDIDFTAAPNTITSTTLNFTTLGILPGMWLKIGGTAAIDQCTVAVNNDWVRVLTVAANVITLDIVPTGWATSVETTSTVKIWMGDRLINGVLARSCTMEMAYNDQTVVLYEVYSGMMIDSFKWSAEAQAIPQLEIGWMGGNATDSTTRTSGATTVAAETNSVMNTSSNIGNIREGGALLAGPNFVNSIAFTVNNNLRMRTAIGYQAAVSIGAGRSNITLEFNTYFGDKTILDKIRNNTNTSYEMRVTDPLGGKAYVVDFPSVKYQSGSPETTGIDSDVMLQMTGQAIMHSVLGYTMYVGRFSYYE